MIEEKRRQEEERKRYEERCLKKRRGEYNGGVTEICPFSCMLPTERCMEKANSNAKPQKLTEQDDIEAYFTTFERMMRAFSIEEGQWIYRFAPQLTAWSCSIGVCGDAIRRSGGLSASKGGCFKAIQH